jgi:uncharacterized repeat protein (TIGR01451 family)
LCCEKLEQRNLLSAGARPDFSQALAAHPHLDPSLIGLIEQLPAGESEPQLGVSRNRMAFDSHGRAGVKITAEDVAAVLPSLESLGFQTIAAQPELHFVEGYLPVSSLVASEDLASQGLFGVLPLYRPVTRAIGSFLDQADNVLQADRVRATVPGYDGTGIRIGVLSDSYNNRNGAATDVSKGDLPSAGVTVLQDLSSGGTDEGRAMLQLIHHLAPGASLVFATAFVSESSFAQNIRNLANPANGNCKIIVDDVFYYDEPFFQDGTVAQAVDYVVNTNGAAYFSAAGNEANQSYESTSVSFVSQAIPNINGGQAADYYAFDAGSATTKQTITVPAGYDVGLSLQWDQPYYTTSGVTTDLDIYLLNHSTGAVVAQTSSRNISSRVPNEILTYTNSTGSSQQYDVVIRKYQGTTPGRIKYVNFGDTISFNTFGTYSSTIVGHAASANAMAVAAAPYYNQRIPESFTSLGPATILFTANGTPQTPQVRAKPDIAAIDGTTTSFFGQNNLGDGLWHFFGTSAAAPHAAAVAALVKQANPSFTPAQIYDRLKTTADPNIGGTPGNANLVGAGLIDAYRAVFGLAAPASLNVNDGFESGVLGQAWEVYNSGAGRTQVLSANSPASGAYHLLMDGSTDNSSFVYSSPMLSEAVLHVNAAGQPNVTLAFDEKEFSDPDQPMPASFLGHGNYDGVAMSVDGTTWYRIATLTGAASSNAYQHSTFNLSQIAAANGLTLSADTRVKFQHYGSSSYVAPTQGFAFDNVQVFLPVPDLTVTKTHSGVFQPGDVGDTYTITVTNSGAAPTSGAVSVVDVLPSGLTATAMSGNGWTVDLATLTATRNDALGAGASYPVLTLTVDVAPDVLGTIVNTATVSGGGETNTANNTASDPTTVLVPPDLTVTKTHSGVFHQGDAAAVYTIVVNNSGLGPTSGAVSLVDTLPSGLTATAMSGTGWTVNLPTLTATRSDVLAPGASYPALTLTVSVAPDAPANVVNTATVSGGSQANTANDTASDPTSIVQTTIYWADMDADPGWSGYQSQQWQWGQPAGSNGDPTSGYSGNNVVGYNLSGSYANRMSSTSYVTTPAINCAGRTAVTLSFWRWLGVQGSASDHASLDVSNNGTTWTNIWQNPASNLVETSWSRQSYDIAAIADNQPTVYIRWGMGPTNNNTRYCGWNIDDVLLTGAGAAAPPVVSDANVSIAGATGTGGAFKRGDTVTATWNNTAAGDNNSGITSVTVDFSQFGGPLAAPATNNSGTWTASYTIAAGTIDAVARNVSVTAANSAGSTTTADTTNATVDSQVPAVTASRISITSAGSGTSGVYRAGDAVTVQWDNTATGDNNFDVVQVTADFSQFGGGTVAAAQSAGVWTATYVIAPGTIDAANRKVSMTATDDAGNATTTAGASSVSVDNQAPAVTGANLSITSTPTGTGGVYRIGDTLTARWNNTAGGDNNADISAVTVDFTQLGGGSAVAATNSSGIWTASYTVLAGSIDATGRNISVTARDDAGNTTSRADATGLSVDNEPPRVTDAMISVTSEGTGTNGTYRVGDTVTVRWDNTAAGDNNLDPLAAANPVAVNFSQFGGGIVPAANDGGIWTASYTVLAGSTDATGRNVSVVVADDAGNMTTTADATDLSVDNQPPLMTDANLSITSVGTGTGGTYRVGDTITARWDNTGAGDNNSDIAAVAVDFSQFGGFGAVPAVNSGGIWTATHVVMADSLSAAGRNVLATATDDAGNATTTADTTNLSIDNQAPAVTDANLTITSSGTAPGGVYRTGDTVTIEWNNTAGGDNNADVAAVTVDFRQFGGPSAAPASSTGGTWTAGYTIVAGTIKAADRNISVTVTDMAGNATTTADTSNLAVDNWPLIAGALTPPTAVEGTPFSNVVLLHFDDPDPTAVVSDYTATITWGDGSSSTVTSVTGPAGQIVAAMEGGFVVRGSHVYATAIAQATFRVEVTDAGGASASAETSDFSVANAPLTAGPLTPPTAAAGTAFVNALLFQFADANPFATADDFTATIDWGDGAASIVTGTAGPDGQVAANPDGGFDVLGSHLYTQILANATFGVQVADAHGAATGASRNDFNVADILIAGANTLTMNADQTARSADISGGGQLNVGPGAGLTVSDNVTLGPDGSIRITDATLTVPNLHQGGDPASLEIDGGTLKAAGTFSTTVSLAIGAGGATIDTGDAEVTLAGPVTGSAGDGGLTKAGAGALTLSSANNYSGGTSVVAGTLVVSNPAALPTGGALVIGSGATVVLSIGLSQASSSAVAIAASSTSATVTTAVAAQLAPPAAVAPSTLAAPAPDRISPAVAIDPVEDELPTALSPYGMANATAASASAGSITATSHAHRARAHDAVLRTGGKTAAISSPSQLWRLLQADIPGLRKKAAASTSAADQVIAVWRTWG